MASKCWFILEQTHYPPPVLPRTGIGKVSGGGPICLGHLIPDLRHLDNVINRQGPLDIPPDMPIYPTKAWGLTWEVKESGGAGVSSIVGMPIAAAAGITIGLDAGTAFKQTTKNYWEFDSLDTFIFQPTSEYIEDSVEVDEVVSYRERRPSFSSSTLFMITGIIVARGAKKTSFASRTRDAYGIPSTEIPTIAKVGFKLSGSSETEISSTGQKTTDFVWAVRLAKITKGLIDRRWSHETLSKGATFGLDGGEESAQDIIDALQDEGLESATEANFEMADDVFVVGADSGETL
ncbi:hypothetical protein V8C40DRAFT_238036 [Trichoderma camerunense]